jgi:hypothetical protein
MAVVSLAPDPYTGLLAPSKRGVSPEYTLHRAESEEHHCADTETIICGTQLEAQNKGNNSYIIHDCLNERSFW